MFFEFFIVVGVVVLVLPSWLEGLFSFEGDEAVSAVFEVLWDGHHSSLTSSMTANRYVFPSLRRSFVRYCAGMVTTLRFDWFLMGALNVRFCMRVVFLCCLSMERHGIFCI